MDRLLRYEGELPQVWVKYDKEKAEVASIPTMSENRTRPEQDQVPGPKLIGNGNPSTSTARRGPHKKTRRLNVEATQLTRDNNRKPTRFKKPKYWTKHQTVHQTGRVSNFRRNATIVQSPDWTGCLDRHNESISTLVYRTSVVCCCSTGG